MDLRAVFSELLRERGDIASDQYLQWFCYILKVLGRHFFDNFVEKTGVDTSLTKLHFWSSTFRGFYRKCTKIGTPKGGQNLPKSIENPLLTAGGPPGVP